MKPHTRDDESRRAIASDTRVDELRDRLRALGYLDAGIARYVLASADRARRPAALAALASLRVAALAALLLGPAAAIGLAARVPGLITGVRDAVVAAIYLGILFGALSAAAAFVAAMAASWIAARTSDHGSRARRAGALARGAGVLVAACSLAYLTLWWRAASAGDSWTAPVWTAFALAVAVAISLLLGHAVSLTARAMAVAGDGGDGSAHRTRSASRKAAFAAAAIAFLGAAVLLVATTGGPAPIADEQLTVRSGGARVTVLAIDGFDANFVDGRIARPADPEARGSRQDAGLFRAFSSARADLAPADSKDPARLWTTVATGVVPHRHGVDGLETRRVAGLRGRVAAGSTGQIVVTATDLLRLTRPAVASNVERRVHTFWEVAERAGLRTAVVNWWATWPAVSPSGIVVSDRAVLRLERGGELDAELAPTEWYSRLLGRWQDIRQASQQRARSTFGDLPDAHLQQVLARSAELDDSMVRIAGAISAQADLDLLVVYLPGLDIAQHALLGERSGDSSAHALEQRLAALRRYYAFLSEATLAAVLDAAREGGHLFVIAQPGRLHEGSGVLAAAGPALKATVTNGSVLDVAPTILHALGVPAARDLDGRVLTGLFDDGFLKQHPVRSVESYGRRTSTVAARGGVPLDEEMIERLRSLGYVR